MERHLMTFLTQVLEESQLCFSMEILTLPWDLLVNSQDSLKPLNISCHKDTLKGIFILLHGELEIQI